MNYIKEKVKESASYKDLFSDYVNRVSKISNDDKVLKDVNKHISTYDKQHEYAMKQMDSYKNIMKEESPFSTRLNSIFTTYEAVMSLDASVDVIVKYMEKPFLQPENIDGDFSSYTYRLETSDYWKKILVQHKSFVKKYKTHTDDFIRHMVKTVVDLLNSQKNIIQSVEQMQEIFRKKTNSIILYTSVIRHLVKKHPDLCEKITKYVESDKTHVLCCEKKSEGKSKEKNDKVIKGNPDLRRFGLLPSSDFMKISDLLSHIKARGSQSSSFEKYAKAHDAAFAVFIRQVFEGFEYTIRTLIIPDETKKFTQKPNFGITDEVITRFDNIKRLPSSGKWKFDKKIIGKSNPKKLYVVETLDGKTYRFLTRSPAGEKMDTPVEYLDRLTSTGYGRSHYYQREVQKKALSNMFLRKPIDVESISRYSSDVDTSMMKNVIFLKMSSVYSGLISEKTVKKGMTANTIISDKKVANGFFDSLLSVYHMGAKFDYGQQFSAGLFPFSELLSSYMANVMYAAKVFTRLLYDTYNRNPLDPKDMNPANLLKKLNDITNEILNMLISDENLYKSVNDKYLLLNFK